VTGEVELLKPWGLPIGVLTSERYSAGTVTLNRGDALIVYSDGLTAARPDLFKDPCTVAAQLDAGAPAAATAQKLVELATSAGGQLPDDLTVVVVRRTPDGIAQ
jgi:sigma-B regulation protein RsbU (phosphoserine phosphatase)